MKAVAAVLLLSSNAFAMYHGPLVVRDTYPGHVRPGYRVTTQCQLWTDKVVRLVNAEGVATKQERPTTVAVEKLFKAIQAARAGKLERKSAPVDGPGVVDAAIYILPNDGIEKVTLLKANGGDGEVVTNLAPEAQGLRRLLDELCR